MRPDNLPGTTQDKRSEMLSHIEDRIASSRTMGWHENLESHSSNLYRKKDGVSLSCSTLRQQSSRHSESWKELLTKYVSADSQQELLKKIIQHPAQELEAFISGKLSNQDQQTISVLSPLIPLFKTILGRVHGNRNTKINCWASCIKSTRKLRQCPRGFTGSSLVVRITSPNGSRCRHSNDFGYTAFASAAKRFSHHFSSCTQDETTEATMTRIIDIWTAPAWHHPGLAQDVFRSRHTTRADLFPWNIAKAYLSVRRSRPYNGYRWSIISPRKIGQHTSSGGPSKILERG